MAPPTRGCEKKKSESSTYTIVEEVVSSAPRSNGNIAQSNAEILHTRHDLVNATLAAVKSNPFASIGELVSDLKLSIAETPVSWWRIWGVLRQNGLLTRRSRFRYARRAAG